MPAPAHHSCRQPAQRASLAGSVPGLRPLVLVALCPALLLLGCKVSNTPGTATARTTTAQITPTAASVAATPRTRPPPSDTVVASAGTPGLFVIAAGRATPETVAVQLGRSVRWRNDDTLPHRIVSDEPGLFDTGEISPGREFELTVAVPGVHDWHDPADPRLRGTVRIMP